MIYNVELNDEIIVNIKYIFFLGLIPFLITPVTIGERVLFSAKSVIHYHYGLGSFIAGQSDL